MDRTSLITELQHSRGALLALLVAVILLYGHTLDVPMYLDDISSISDNPAIQNISEWKRIFAFSEMRFIGYLSFAANYEVHGDSVAGYHIVNLLIHLTVASLLYFLLMALAETPALKASATAQRMPFIALGAALLFLVHPLHTQAVTYIVQRLASLVALFYLLSVFAYVRGRLDAKRHRWLWFALAGLAGLLALFTKQNAITLPGAILLVEACFFSRGRADVIQLVRWVGGAVLLFSLILMLAMLSGVLTWEQLDQATRETPYISRMDYSAAQSIVLWRYLGLFVWPDPLVLDYGVAPTWRFSDVQVWLALLGHTCVLALGMTLVRRAPLLAFGILFYYMAHMVESGIIPIKDLMFEHRTYLPDVGLCIVVIAALSRLRGTVAIAIALAALFTLSVVTWQRNNLWRDQVAFFNHAIAHAPGQPRNWLYLSKVYHKAGENQQALYFLTQELNANEERYGRLRVDTATMVFWAKLLRVTGKHEMAERVEADLVSRATPVQRQRILLHRGNALLEAGELEQASEAYREVLRINPRQTSASINLGVVALMQEDYAEAIAIFERFPDHPVSRANLPGARAALQGNYRFEGVEERVIEKAQ